MKRPNRRKFQNPNNHVMPLPPDKLEQLLHGAAVPDIHREQRLELARKEFDMPDIKTALTSALAKAKDQPTGDIPPDWDDEGGAAAITEVQTTNQQEKPMQAQTTRRYFQPTTNVTRRAFEYIKDNPGCNKAQYTKVLTMEGHNPASLSTLLSQMQYNGLIRNDESGGYHAVASEYRPLKPRSVLKAAQKKDDDAEKRRAKTAAARAARWAKKEVKEEVSEVKEVREKEAKKHWDASDVLNGLSVLQARALYDELRKIFGA
jgi:hypothetical protein